MTTAAPVKRFYTDETGARLAWDRLQEAFESRGFIFQRDEDPDPFASSMVLFEKEPRTVKLGPRQITLRVLQGGTRRELLSMDCEPENQVLTLIAIVERIESGELDRYRSP